MPSTPTPSGRTSPTGGPSWRRSTTRPSGCWAWSKTRCSPRPTMRCAWSPRQMGVGATFRKTPVAVYFGEPGKEADDPYFGGAGPRRTGCVQCGECMIGCRHNAKNRLDLTYLYLAERNGAEVHPLTTVTEVRPTPGGGYTVETVPSGTWRRTQARPSLPRPAGGVRRRLARDPAAAARDARRGGAAANLPATGGAHPHQLRIDRRRDGQVHQDRLHPGCGDHLVVLPG